MNDSNRIGLRRIGRQGLWYAGSTLLNRGVSFLMLPVYTRYLTPTDYGIIQLIELTFDVLSIIAGSRLALGVFTFFHKAETEDERRKVLASAFVLVSGLATLVGLVAFLAAPLLSRLVFGSLEQENLFRLYALAFALSLTHIVPFAWLRIAERAKESVALGLLKTIVQLVVNVVCLTVFGLGVTSLVLGNVLGSAVLAIPLWTILLRRVGLQAPRSWIVRHLRFSLPLVATQVATFLLTFGDRYFLKAYASTAAVGLYSLSYQFGFLLQQIGFAPFNSVWESARFAIAKQENRDAVFARAFLFINILLVTLATGISLFVTDTLRVMTTPPFHSAGRIVPIILLAYIMQAWYGFQDIGIHISERTKYTAISNWVSGAVIILLYFLLIPPLGGLGAALATLISFTLRWSMTYTFSQRLWPVRYEWGPVRRLLMAAGTVVGVAWLLPTPPLKFSIPMNAALFGVYLALVWFGGVISREDRSLLLRHPTQLLEQLRQSFGTRS